MKKAAPLPRVLVHLHVFYTDELEHYLRRLRALRSTAELHLIASVSEAADGAPEVIARIRAVFPEADVFTVPNIGYDLAPFIEALHRTDLDRWDAVLKLHTKKRGTGDIVRLNGRYIHDTLWVALLTEVLIGSPERFSAALGTVLNGRNGLAAADACILTEAADTGDADPLAREAAAEHLLLVNHELRLMGLPELQEVRFAAGTMFIARARLLKPLLRYGAGDFGKVVPGVKDYTFAHTMERLPAAVAAAQGYEAAPLRTKPHRVAFLSVALRMRTRTIRNADLPRFLRVQLMCRCFPAEVIRRSRLFDAAGYLAAHPEAGKTARQAAAHYLREGRQLGYEPSAAFDGAEYLARYPDVRQVGIDPLLHYETAGVFEGRTYKAAGHRLAACIAQAEERDPRPMASPDCVFPAEAEPCERTYAIAPRAHGRTAVLACTCPGGRISPALPALLQGLHEAADNIVLVGDGPLLPEEPGRLGSSACYMRFIRHGAGVFGSYRDGLAAARRLGLLDEDAADEVILCSDACTGPLFPFAEAFAAMAGGPHDFWGFSALPDPELRPLPDAYFMVFGRRILDARLLEEYLKRVDSAVGQGITFNAFALRLSRLLLSQGMVSASLVDPEAYAAADPAGRAALLRSRRVPLCPREP